MARRIQEFQTIRSEGGLLPADLLRRVLDRGSNLAGTRPEDYGLPAGDRLNEVITQSWNRLRKHWAEFREAAANLPATEAGTGLTNDRWNLPLLRELGFGLLPASAGPEIDGRTYAISRFFGPVPVHLIGCHLSPDRRIAGQRGAAVANPHGLVQEFLNRSDAHLWALLSNGLRLRILRDNQALSRQSFLEFDLEAMMNGEVYSDFALLWLVTHATRFAPRGGDRPETCWLEQWTQEAGELGTRALGELRRGVEQALAILGEGFTSHPKNAALRDALRSGTLSPTALHAQLLRLIYRLIFLFVAEDRTLEGQSLLHPLDDSDTARTARERYAAHYSTARLREMAGRIKGSRHGDLWRQFQILVRALAGEAASASVREQLALPALGSFLWDPPFTPELNDAELTNFDLLEALRHLAFTRQGKLLRPVDYKNLGAEELGGVYESLLALTPQVSGDGARFTFAEFAGNERKTSGSYYTPDSLVQCLLDSALDPVVEQAIKGKSPAEAEQAILALTVCDPAVGSGHFLVGAAHRLARHLARVRAYGEGESEPSPLLYQHALRDVIGHCLYGVDVNPMAAELCRVSLWLESLEPGKPLSFLDHHIRVGNSLLGTTPELIAEGLPDDAFKPIEGDDKKVCSALKKRNKQEREGRQMDIGLPMVAETRAEYDTLASRSHGIDQAPDDSLEAIERKAEQFRRLVLSPEYRHRQLVADAWCAAFVWPKTADASEAITTETVRRLEQDADALDTSQRAELEGLAGQYQFFHWELAFPEVFDKGGFDCVLGNPPWDKVKFQEREWFAGSQPGIANAQTAASRRKLIESLRVDEPEAHSRYIEALREAEASSHFFGGSNLYPLGAGGDQNTYPLFLELALRRSNFSGRVGMIVKTGILADFTMRGFFAEFVEKSSLVSAWDFSNKKLIFPDVVANERFTLLTVSGGSEVAAPAEISILNESIDDINRPERRWLLSAEDAARINPNTLTSPLFQERADAELVKHVYRQHPVVVRESQMGDLSDWGVRYFGMFHMSNDSGLFVDQECLEGMASKPLSGSVITEDGVFESVLEGKLFDSFHHRHGDFNGIPRNKRFGRKAEPNHPDGTNLQDPTYVGLPRYWLPQSESHHRYLKQIDFVPSGVLAFRDVCRTHTDSRTVRACICPPYAAGNKAPLLLFPKESKHENAIRSVLMCGCLCSFAFDYVARQKFSGGSLNKYIFIQLPIISPRIIGNTWWYEAGVLSAVLELSFTAWDLELFSLECGWDGPPFRWDEERRALIRCELDAAFFHLYLPADENGDWRPAKKSDGCPYDETLEQLDELKSHFPTPRDAVDYIMDTFPIVRRKDEEAYGEYRTKRVILEIYDAMQEAMRTGEPYETRLNPPPGPPLDEEGNFLSYAAIADNPPPHIHLPRDAEPSGDVPLQLSDLSAHFPDVPFQLRLGTGNDADELHIRPLATSELGSADTVLLASPKLQRQGTSIPAAIGRLRAESRTDANDGSAYLLVSVRGDDGLAQARFSEEEWQALTTVGVVENVSAEEVANG